MDGWSVTPGTKKAHKLSNLGTFALVPDEHEWVLSGWGTTLLSSKQSMSSMSSMSAGRSPRLEQREQSPRSGWSSKMVPREASRRKSSHQGHQTTTVGAEAKGARVRANFEPGLPISGSHNVPAPPVHPLLWC
jgi:hypothetical protein